MLYLVADDVNVLNSTFKNNTCTYRGGAIYYSANSTGSVINCDFINCNNTGDNKAISTVISNLLIENCTYDNSSKSNEVNNTGSFNIKVKDIVYGDSFIINITDATGVNGVLLNGTVDVSVDGKVYSFNVTDGESSYKVSDILPAGKYIVNASLSVPNYDKMINNTSFVVTKDSTKFINATKGTVYNGKYYSVRLTDNSGNKTPSTPVASVILIIKLSP